jgi:hypothetical protein
LFFRYLPPTANRSTVPKIVLYVYGATVPSSFSIAHHIDGRDMLAHHLPEAAPEKEEFTCLS